MDHGGEEEIGKGKRRKEDERTISDLDKSHPTTTSTASLFKNSSISFSRSTFAPFSPFFGSRTNGDNVGRAVRETRGFKDWICGVAAVVLCSSVPFPVVDIAEGITKDGEQD